MIILCNPLLQTVKKWKSCPQQDKQITREGLNIYQLYMYVTTISTGGTYVTTIYTGCTFMLQQSTDCTYVLQQYLPAVNMLQQYLQAVHMLQQYLQVVHISYNNIYRLYIYVTISQIAHLGWPTGADGCHRWATIEKD